MMDRLANFLHGCPFRCMFVFDVDMPKASTYANLDVAI